MTNKPTESGAKEAEQIFPQHSWIKCLNSNALVCKIWFIVRVECVRFPVLIQDAAAIRLLGTPEESNQTAVRKSQNRPYGCTIILFQVVTEWTCQRDDETRCLDVWCFWCIPCWRDPVVRMWVDVRETVGLQTEAKLCWFENVSLQSASAQMKTDMTHQPHASSDL